MAATPTPKPALLRKLGRRRIVMLAAGAKYLT